MTMVQRVLLAVLVVALDLLIFFIPLTGFFLAYVLIINPPWFRSFIINLDPPEDH